MSNMESLPQLEQTGMHEIPRVEKTGWAKKHGEFALQEVTIEYPADLVST